MARESGPITDELRAEKLINILDRVPVGIGLFDDDGLLLHANAQFGRNMGADIMSLDCLLADCRRGFLDDGTQLSLLAHPVTKAMAGEIVTPAVEFNLRDDLGKEVRLSMSVVPLASTTISGISGAMVVVEDISDGLRASPAPGLEITHFQRFAEHSHHALWITHASSGAVEYLSPAAKRLWGMESSGQEHGDWLQAVHQDDRQRLLEARADAAHGIVRKLHYRLVDTQGIIRFQIRETCFAIPAGPGQEDWIGGIVEDVSPEIQIYLIQHPNAADPTLNDALVRSNHRIKRFSSAEALMHVADVLNPGCVIVDIRGIDLAAASLSRILSARPADLQIVFIGDALTESDEIIATMRAGAIDFLLAPVTSHDLDEAVRHACEALPSRFEQVGEDRHDLHDRLARLPRRERDVLLGLVDGGTNKSIARTLGISPRTVEVHRAHLMERLDARNLSELLQMAHRAGIGQAGHGDRDRHRS